MLFSNVLLCCLLHADLMLRETNVDAILGPPPGTVLAAAAAAGGGAATAAAGRGGGRTPGAAAGGAEVTAAEGGAEGGGRLDRGAATAGGGRGKCGAAGQQRVVHGWNLQEERDAWQQQGTHEKKQNRQQQERQQQRQEQEREKQHPQQQKQQDNREQEQQQPQHQQEQEKQQQQVPLWVSVLQRLNRLDLHAATALNPYTLAWVLHTASNLVVLDAGGCRTLAEIGEERESWEGVGVGEEGGKVGVWGMSRHMLSNMLKATRVRSTSLFFVTA